MAQGPTSTELAQSRTDWAEARTDWAEGFGKAAASVCLLAAVGVIWPARARAKVTLTRLHSRDCIPQSTMAYALLATALSLATVMTGVVLWLL